MRCCDRKKKKKNLSCIIWEPYWYCSFGSKCTVEVLLGANKHTIFWWILSQTHKWELSVFLLLWYNNCKKQSTSPINIGKSVLRRLGEAHAKCVFGHVLAPWSFRNKFQWKLINSVATAHDDVHLWFPIVLMSPSVFWNGFNLIIVSIT